ncbi:adenosine receptor A2b-like [Clytia hemisphaerica]|uniref:G-protein coupled receptors family 1 profile domain-containing protein n=1 Tax=Clytia hemisphaerica TaxID=252671 RepID=A0A7M5XAM9_9CNID|eukprot:TCONS_00069483-protein
METSIKTSVYNWTTASPYSTYASILLQNSSANMTNLTNQNRQLQGSCESVGDIQVEMILYCIFIAIIMLSSVVGNLLTVLSIIMSRSLKKRVTFYFIASLACSDFCFAVFLLPFRITTRLNGNRFCHAVPACYVMIISDAIVNVASILNLLLIALDRFIAIKFPFIYTERMTGRAAKRMIAGVWSFAMLWSFLGIFRWDNNGSMISITTKPVCANVNYNFYAASSFGIYITVLIIITSSYITILMVALKQIKAIEATSVTVVLLNPNNNGSPGTTDKNKKRRRRRLNRELRATKSVAIVFLAYVICWLPLYVINVIIQIDSNYFLKLDKGVFLFIYYAFVEILPAVNTMINPFIYSFSNKQFRDAFKRIISKTLGLRLNLMGQDDFCSLDMSSLPNSPSVSRMGSSMKKV